MKTIIVLLILILIVLCVGPIGLLVFGVAGMAAIGALFAWLADMAAEYWPGVLLVGVAYAVMQVREWRGKGPQ